MPKARTGALVSGLRTAQSAFNRASVAEASRILDDLDGDPRVELLRARVLLRTDRPIEALQALLQLSTLADPVLEAERRILLGAAYGFSRDFDAGLAEIRRGCENDVPAPLRADAQYFSAFIHWLRYDNTAAEEALKPLRSDPDPNERARANILQAWIEIRRNDIERHLALLVSALDDFESAGDRAIVFHYARTLSTLASLAREMSLPAITARIRGIEAGFPWTPELAADRFTVLRSFGWLDSLAGDSLSAFRELKLAAEIAPTEGLRLLSMLDRAFLAASMGERSFADDQLTDAKAFAAQLRWDETTTEERAALLVLASLVAQVDAPAALTYLAQFRSLQNTSRSHAFATDARTTAFMSLWSGVARAALGDTREAEQLLQDACSIFDAFRYEWRSALAAHHLFKLTGERKWHDIAKARIRAYPESWLARMIRGHEEFSGVAPRLTPAQRQVFDALREGASTLAIAKRLGRSPHTVRNHISDIFEAFGVRSRAELLARLKDDA